MKLPEIDSILAKLCPATYNTAKTKKNIFPVEKKDVLSQKNEQPHFSMLQANNDIDLSCFSPQEYEKAYYIFRREEYILPEIHNAVSVGLYSVFKACYSVKGCAFPLNYRTKHLPPDNNGRITSYGIKIIYCRFMGGKYDWTDYALKNALDELTEYEYINVYYEQDTPCYVVTDKPAERLLNADEFISYAQKHSLNFSIGEKFMVELHGQDKQVASALYHMLNYSASLGFPDLSADIRLRLHGYKLSYDSDINPSL